jgi:hypothetical protein
MRQDDAEDALPYNTHIYQPDLPRVIGNPVQANYDMLLHSGIRLLFSMYYIWYRDCGLYTCTAQLLSLYLPIGTPNGMVWYLMLVCRHARKHPDKLPFADSQPCD